MASLHISLDGRPLSVESGTTLGWLMEALWEGTGIRPTVVAVDSEYVSPESWPSTTLRSGQRIETLGR